MTATKPAVVLVEPAEGGNIGMAARGMKNFGFETLLLVDPTAFSLDGPAGGFAGHAKEDVLAGAKEATFEEIVETYHTVGFTAIPNEDDRKHVRFPFQTPAQLGPELLALERPVALVFGPEGTGLDNEQFANLDQICSIPANVDYPVLNLAQAVTVSCYALDRAFSGGTQHPDSIPRAEEPDIERLYEQIDAYLAAINHPEEKRAKTSRMMRRVIGRAHPTGREVNTMMGLFRRGSEFADPPQSSDR